MDEDDRVYIDEVDDVADALLELCEAYQDGPYAGLEVGDGEVLVYRVPGDAAFDAAVLAYATDEAPVVLIDAPRNLAADNALMEEILLQLDDIPMLVSSVGPCGSGTGVEVTGSGDLEAAQAFFDARYGEGLVRVAAGGAVWA